jgi:hypothetical protein
VDALEDLCVALNVDLCCVDLLESNSLAVSQENTANLKISKMWMRQKIYLARHGE